MSQAPTSVPFRTSEQIEREADRLRAEHRVESIPVDPYDLATRLGIVVYQATFGDRAIAGALRSRDGGPEILVRQGDPVSRQAFTVAHELGHYVLHWRGDEGPGTFVDSDSELYRHGPPGPEADPGDERDRRRREVQANMFAAALLMPEADVRAVWARTRSVKGLARSFEVSPEAVRYRIEQLGLW